MYVCMYMKPKIFTFRPVWNMDQSCPKSYAIKVWQSEGWGETSAAVNRTGPPAMK